MFTREISSQGETRTGMKSSLSMVKRLLLFLYFWQDEISSRDEIIPVKKAEIEFHCWMEKRQKRRVNTSSRDEVLQ